MTWTKSDRLAAGVSRFGLIGTYLIAAASVVGFGVFRIWPGLLASLPGAAATYPIALAFLPRAQIIAAFGALAFYLTWRVGHRWLAGFIAVYTLSLGSELAGTTLGVPFGHYAYTDALGAKWFGHVPLLIPFSWFMMALPSYALASVGRANASGTHRVALASLILLAWDLSLDPAMSAATAFWVWGEPGAYYGMPWLNLFGWYVTGLVLMVALELLGAKDWIRRLSMRYMAAFYGANLALSLGIAAVAGMWLAFAATAALLGVCWILARPRLSEVQVLA